MSLDSALQRLWYGPAWRSAWLWPASLLFAMLVTVRRRLFAWRVVSAIRVPKPVIVVGNLTVGGTGKTPVVIWLAKALALRGWRVGIITRGYGGQAAHWPQAVTADSDAARVGDEAVLLAQETGAIVCAGPDRVAAARLAIARGAELILSDDGLQHYRLARDLEIAVIDAQRGLGNGWWLPAGPLREGPRRLRGVDAILFNHRASHPGAAAAQVAVPAGTPTMHCRLQLGAVHYFDGRSEPLSALAGERVHVVTGIGHPQGFIASLTAAGLRVDARVLPDHARLRARDLQFADLQPVLMTGKDAVKCRAFAAHHQGWVAAEVQFDADNGEQLLALIQRSLHSHTGAPV